MNEDDEAEVLFGPHRWSGVEADPDDTDFGQTDFGQKLVFQSFCLLFQNKKKKQNGSPKFGALFSLFRPHFALFVSLWVSSREILVVFEAPGP